jgi:ADP-ribosylglycohydrolase
VTGMLAGVAVGDAMGMPTEFLTPEQIREWYGRVDGFMRAHPDHPHHRLQAGMVTDDTDHTIILADLLIEHGEIDPRAMAEKLLVWAESPRVRENRFVGPSTLKTLAGIKRGLPLEQVSRSGTTVGAAMRVAPLAIYFDRRAELIDQVVASCSVSHFTRNAISGAMAMAFACQAALESDALPAGVALAAQEGAVVGREYGDWSWAPPIERRIAHVAAWVESDAGDEGLVLRRLYELIGVDLYPEQLVPCAIGLMLLTEGDPQRAIRLAANLGGDSDTLGAMAGALCGGLRGVNACDRALVTRVEQVNHLDLGNLANRLIEAGSSRQEERQ